MRQRLLPSKATATTGVLCYSNHLSLWLCFAQVVPDKDERYLLAGYNNGMVRLWTGWQTSQTQQGKVEELISFKGADAVPLVAMHYMAGCRAVAMISAKGGHYHASQQLSLWALDKLAYG